MHNFHIGTCKWWVKLNVSSEISLRWVCNQYPEILYFYKGDTLNKNNWNITERYRTQRLCHSASPSPITPTLPTPSPKISSFFFIFAGNLFRNLMPSK